MTVIDTGSGPRVVGWLDHSAQHNDCVEHGGPYPAPTPENDSGSILANHAMRYYADTGDGTPGVLMVNAESGLDGGALRLNPLVTTLQPDSVVFWVVQRCIPDPYPTHESFEGVLPGGTGYAAALTGTIAPFVPAPTPAIDEVQTRVRFPGPAAYDLTLGDGINFGWGVVMYDAADPFATVGSVKITDTLVHVLAVRLVGSTQVTLFTDGAPEVLAANDSAGAAGSGDDRFGYSGIYDTHGGAPLSDDERDAAFLKALVVYIGQLTDGEIAGVAAGLRDHWNAV